ncbi:hypothetical protein Tco_1277238, partial [Tanacetum coccineum]
MPSAAPAKCDAHVKRKEIADTPDHPFPQTAPRTTEKHANQLPYHQHGLRFPTIALVLHPINAAAIAKWRLSGMKKEITRTRTANIQPSHSVAKKNELRNRLNAFVDNETGDGVDGTIVWSLIEMLDQKSSIAQAFRMARDWCHSHTSVNVELRLLFEKTNSRQYNAPTVAEVAALITNDFGDGDPTRNIIVNTKDGRTKRILKLHPSYMALQYPLIFPYGEDGY